MDAELRDLDEAADTIWDLAARMGLDPFPTHFEIVPASIMYEFGAYGLPGRFSHWTHGKAYHRTKMMYDYGLSKIYELVINSNPCYAFLLEGNPKVQNKLVIAHVLAHCDFFKNNVYFKHTNRQMIEGASVNADRIRRYEFQYGKLEVEEFLDSVLAIQEHIDPNLFVKRKPREDVEKEARPRPEGPFDDLRTAEEQRRDQPTKKESKFPEVPEKDLLLFIAQNAAGLQDWHRDVIQIVRNEMLYFLPQMQTKIMNEGWASFWHARMMRELDLSSHEYLEFAELHANVVSPSRMGINPYYVGMKIFEDIEKRWDNPTDEERQKFGRKGGEGRQKIFEARELENDVSFLRTYLTKQLVDDLDLYVYKLEGEEWKVVESDWEKIRDSLVVSMTNFGNPYIVIEDADYRRNRELYLKHSFEGIELDLEYAEKTLRHVYRLWGRTVHLETVVDNSKVVMAFDGEKNTTQKA
ncbi:MAG: SpoVR family protein [Chloroflexi bacterium]|nr:SpoVR family protein [Chloroflexota bacterium]